MSVRKRSWTTESGEDKTAWVVDYSSQGQRRLKTFLKKRDADAYHAQIKTEIRQGIHSAGSTTIAAAGEDWLASRTAAGLERSTLQAYEGILKLHVTPLIGSLKLADLTLPKLRKFEDELRKAVSAAMTKKILACLSGILADAQERGNVVLNVMLTRRRKNGHEARHKERAEIGRDIPTVAEIKNLIAHLDPRGRERALLLTAIFTGLRASELRGLRWQDVHFANAEIHVRQRADRYAQIGNLKSGAGRRTVPLLPMLVSALREWKLACPPSPGDLVFPGRGGGDPLALQTIVTQHWHPAQMRAGLIDATGRPKYSGFHALRHFYASWCINRRADGGLELPLKVVQGRLGHSSIAMTGDVYGHLFPRADDAAEMLRAEQAFLA
jgi:integrase